MAVLALVGWLLSLRDDAGDAPTAGTGATETTQRTTSSTLVTSTTAPTTATSPTSTDAFRVAPGATGVVGTGGPLVTYTVEVEDGVDVDPAGFAAAVDATLADHRSWIGVGDVRLQRVGPDQSPRFRVRLATPDTVDAHCAPLDTAGRYSCRNGADVMLNLDRWLTGAAPAEMPLDQYRLYMVNHEVGHALGHGHEACPSPDAVAPVMLQQTKGLQGCAPNPWPYP